MTTRRFFVDSMFAGSGSNELAAVGKFSAGSDHAPLLASAPVLMNPYENTMDVVFAVDALASGWVDVSSSPDMESAVRVYSGYTSARLKKIRSQSTRSTFLHG